MKKFITRLLTYLLTSIFICTLFTACGGKKEKVVIYTSAADFRIAHMSDALTKQFPNYDFVIEYLPTSKHAAKLMAEGTNTECDIVHDLAYLSLDELDKKGVLADLSSYDRSAYCDDVVKGYGYLPEIRVGGAIIVNPDVIKERNLDMPTSYEDLVKPEYKGLISMPNPKATGSGYMFLKALVNAWGEEKAYSYFDKLAANVLQFTSSGNAPVNAASTKEVAIALGYTSDAVIKLNDGVKLQIVIPEEGSPFAMYGQAIVKGKESREAVKKVFDYLVGVYNYDVCKVFRPEQVFADKVFEVKNFPTNIKYADMSNDTLSEKKRLLDKWKY